MTIEAQAKQMASAILGNLDKKRARQLGRGSIFLQRGMFRNHEEWAALRAAHPEKLARLNRTLGV